MTSALDLEFTCVDMAGVTREIAYEVGRHADHSYIRPKSALTAGERCNLRSRVVDCDLTGYHFIEPELWKSQDRSYLTSRASFVVAAAAPLPAALGRLALQPAALERIELSEGSGCNVRQEVCAIRASIELSDEARAWQDELVYETWIDGARWRVQLAAPLPLEQGASYLGRGREIFFAYRPGVRQMADVRGLSVGKHEVVVRASLPDTNVAIATEPVSIDLNCFASSGAAGGGADAAIDAGSTPDAAAEPDADVLDAGGDAPAKPRREKPEARSSSCSCEAVGARAGGVDPALCVVVAALALYRRRRKASSHP